MIKESIERCKSETPEYFKKLQKIALKLGGATLAVLGVSIIPGVILDPVFIKVISYITVVCAATAGTSQLTRKPDIENDKSQ